MDFVMNVVVGLVGPLVPGVLIPQILLGLSYSLPRAAYWASRGVLGWSAVPAVVARTLVSVALLVVPFGLLSWASPTAMTWVAGSWGVKAALALTLVAFVRSLRGSAARNLAADFWNQTGRRLLPGDTPAHEAFLAKYLAAAVAVSRDGGLAWLAADRTADEADAEPDEPGANP